MTNAKVITVEHLSKRYTLGRMAQRGDGLRHAIEAAIRSPFKPLRSRRQKSGPEDFWALRDVSLEIGQGEVVGIIGRNGAGKSTLLKILSRITEPTDGRITLRGRVASLLEVGTGFHSELTGRENIYLNGAILGMTRVEIKNKFDEIVAFSEVEKFIDTPVKRYSSGMYVRLAFAVAAHLEPEILIVDEVLAVGDIEFQKKCLGKMRNVASEQGRTVLFVSHQMAAIQNLCRRCLLLHQGELLQAGPTDEVVNAYLLQASKSVAGALSDRRDRKGHGDVQISALQFREPNGNEIHEAVSGKPFVFRVFYAAKPGAVVKNCRVAVTIGKERAFFILSTDLVDKTPLHLTGRGYIDFLVPEWPLSGGTYHIATYIGSHSDALIQDWIEDAEILNVTDGDFFGTGKLYPAGLQGTTVLVHHSWSRAEETSDAAFEPVELSGVLTSGDAGSPEATSTEMLPLGSAEP